MFFQDWGFGLGSSLLRCIFQLAKSEFPCMVLNFIRGLRSCV